MLPILQFIVKNGLAAATKKFGTVAVKQAIKKPSKGKPKKTPNKPSPKRSDINPLTGKTQPPKAKAKGSTNKPKSKPKSGKPKGTKSTKDFLGEMFGRKRTGKTPKPSDSKAYRDGVKAGQKKADEKLNPSLRNKDMAPRSIENRRLDVLRQIREAKASGSSPKMIERLQARAQNLKNMKSDRPDLTTMRGKFKDGGSVIDLRKSGLFTKTTNNLKTSPRPVGRNDAAEAKAVEGGNRESARVAREDPMYLRHKARKNKK